MATNALTKFDGGLSLELPKSQTFDEWLDIGRNLASANKVLQWWIGDWWAAGSHRYGERAKMAAEGVFGHEFGSLANMASVCRAFTTSRRREHLSFSHHAEVASLEPKQADELLDRAVGEAWSTRDLRARVIADRRGGSPKIPDEYLIREKAPDIALEIEAEAQRIGKKLPDFLAFLLALGWQNYKAMSGGV